jgi:hypothetical protein
MSKIIILLTAVAAYGQVAFDANATDAFQGVYTGKELRLELRGEGGGYTGRIEVQGQVFPVTGRVSNGQLAASFVSGANRFAFQATVQNSTMRLVSEGTEYVLVRQGGGAAAHVHPKGFSVQAAAGWTARDNEQGVLLVPAGAAEDEIYLAALQDGYSQAEEAKSVRELSQAFLQNVRQVRRSGERQPIGNGASYYWEMVDPQTGKIVGLRIYFVPAGTQANVIVAFGAAQRIQPRDGELRQMLASMRTAAAKPAAGGCAGRCIGGGAAVAEQAAREDDPAVSHVSGDELRQAAFPERRRHVPVREQQHGIDRRLRGERNELGAECAARALEHPRDGRAGVPDDPIQRRANGAVPADEGRAELVYER